MNFYKKILKNQNTRLKILKMLKFIPDKTMLKIQYKIKTGNKLNLKNPKRYTEKIQWYKLNYRTPLMTKCADKFTVREYVKEKELGFLLNEIYAYYYNPDDFTFDNLPNSFAIKCSKGSGLNYFVQDKSKEDINKIKDMIREWMKDDSYAYGREWCYKGSKPCILVEKLIPRDEFNDIPDYKFFCFNGKVYCLYTMKYYTDNHAKGKLGFYDDKFNQLPYFRLDFNKLTEPIKKPENFDLMVKYAEILSSEFPHARIDFYNVSGKIIFGEITFYNACGYTKFTPDEFDYIMGEKFILPKKTGVEL